MQDNISDEGGSVLASLRALVPDRPLRFIESLRIAEWQATQLLKMSRIEDGPVSSDAICSLPRIKVVRRDIPTSGLSFWDGAYWVICLNRSEPSTRQRFTLFHEYKHIVDHGKSTLLYRGSGQTPAEQMAERAADYFAGCVLMPRTLLKRAWTSGLQSLADLSAYFETSEPAIAVRLAQVGLRESATARCVPSSGLRTAQGGAI